METVVLPAQDHLAQERHRYQSRMSGMIYPLGGLPKTRRKLKTPTPGFGASIHLEARVSLNQSAPAVDMRNPSAGAAAHLDLSCGILRGARFSSSPSARHMPGLSAPQYRLHSTPSKGFSRSESSRSGSTSPVQSKQQGTSGLSSSPLVSGSNISSPLVIRKRPDGELLKKGGDVDKTSERRRSFENILDSSKNGYDRKNSEKTAERFDKHVEKNKMFERKSAEKKSPACKNQGEKPSNPPKKGIITILQRPQTKEAAAENLVMITGIAVEPVKVTKSTLSSEAASESTPRNVDSVSSIVASEDGRNTEVSSKESDSGSSPPVKGRPGSPKAAKKKPVREYPRNSACRTHHSSHSEEKLSREGSGNLHTGHSVRLHVENEKRKAKEDRREVSPAASHSSGEGISASKAPLNPGVLVLSPEDYSSAHSLSDSQLKKSSSRNYASKEAGYRSSEEFGGKQHGVARSDSYRDIPRRSESCEVIISPSSPPIAAGERWAGPAYSNSPPPSTLPFPTFPKQRTKSALNGVSLGALLDPLVPELVPTKASSAPSSPTRTSADFFSDLKKQESRLDPSSATKDLIRILNLDVECAVGGFNVSIVPSDAECLVSSTEQLSATQSLKRMLQLG